MTELVAIILTPEGTIHHVGDTSEVIGLCRADCLLDRGYRVYHRDWHTSFHGAKTKREQAWFHLNQVKESGMYYWTILYQNVPDVVKLADILVEAP